MNSPQLDIERLLRERQPASLLLLSPDNSRPDNNHSDNDRDNRWRVLCQSYCQQLLTPAYAAVEGGGLDGIGHVDLALVVGLIERLDKPDAIALLGRLRNLHTDLLYVLVGDDPRWTLADWLALGLQRAGEFTDSDGSRLTLYRYDLGNYNRTRSWNNPKHWANPENWGRFRW